jgi:hypothetical protein
MRHYRTARFPKYTQMVKLVGKHSKTSSHRSMRFGSGLAILMMSKMPEKINNNKI